MPIYEYLCADCGNKFEKLIRRNEDVEKLECPSCGESAEGRPLSLGRAA